MSSDPLHAAEAPPCDGSHLPSVSGGEHLVPALLITTILHAIGKSVDLHARPGQVVQVGVVEDQDGGVGKPTPRLKTSRHSLNDNTCAY